MRYVEAWWSEQWHAYWTNPEPYLAELPNLREDLPAGAWAYAADPTHYDYYGARCVKDLRLEGIEFGADGPASLRVGFAANALKHQGGLVVHYTGVASLSLAGPAEGGDLAQLGEVMLDEVLPAASGCSHEVAFHHGTLTVVCGDLHARWLD